MPAAPLPPDEAERLRSLISLGILDKLGGKITVDSQTGQGAAVSIILPVRG